MADKKSVLFEKLSPDEIRREHDIFMEKNFFWKAFDIIPDAILVFNRARQIIYANKAFLKFVNVGSTDEIYGRRLGETLSCVNADRNGEGSCGTSEFCEKCGGTQALLNGLSGISDVKECRIYRKDSLGSLDFRVWTAPMRIEGDDENYVLATISDISDEKRRKILERIFFHDIMNTAGGISGMISLIKESLPPELHNVFEAMEVAANSLVEEINAQKQLVAAENNELKPSYGNLNSLAVINDIRRIYKGHEVAWEKNIEIRDDAADISFKSDLTIIKRVLGNMLKNAIEASRKNETVTLGCRLSEDGTHIRFSVHNRGFMPREVQLQVFQRSFSTKGYDRGIGTYSIKFLSEKYLKGKVRFESDEEKGTTFYAEYPLDAV